METICGVNMLLVYLVSWFARRYALNHGLIPHDTQDQVLFRTV